MRTRKRIVGYAVFSIVVAGAIVLAVEAKGRFMRSIETGQPRELINNPFCDDPESYISDRYCDLPHS